MYTVMDMSEIKVLFKYLCTGIQTEGYKLPVYVKVLWTL